LFDQIKTNLQNLAMKLRILPLIVLVTVALAPDAQAHILPSDIHGLREGFQHPIGGLDHLLAMVAVGVWAAQMGGNARWRVPSAFVGVMTVGGVLGFGGSHLPGTEFFIALSSVVLGAAIALATRPGLPVAMGLVGAFALFHGYAHGREIPSAASGLAYGAGFILATGVLHAAGFVLAAGLSRMRRDVWVRVAGGVMACIAAILLLG